MNTNNIHHTTDIEQMYVRQSDALFAAMLREPQNFHRFAAKISPAMFQASRFDRAAAALCDLYRKHKRYTPAAIAETAGMNLSDLQQVILRNDVDLDFAWSAFEPVYRVWVEYRRALMVPALINKGMDAAAIKREQDEFVRKSGAYQVTDDVDFGEFDKWIADKLDGYEPDYPCKPFLPTMRRALKYFEPGTITLIAGRPGMGKTQIALNMLEYFDDCGLNGVFNSLEMSNTQLMKRRIGIRTGYDPNAYWGNYSTKDRQRIADEAAKIKAAKCRMVSEYGALSFVSLLHSISYEQPIQYAFIDYVQLMKYESRGRGMNRDNELSEIMRELMEVSKSLNICLIAMAQFNRDVEKRGGSKRPSLSDLRDSGSLEQAAHYVFAPYRPEYYDIQEDETGQSTKGFAEIITLKNRNGATDTFSCRFDPVRGFYENEPEMIPQFETFTANRSEDVPF